MLKKINGIIVTRIAHSWDIAKSHKISFEKSYLHVDEEDGNWKGSECIMGEVVGHEFDLTTEVRGFSVWDDVVDEVKKIIGQNRLGKS